MKTNGTIAAGRLILVFGHSGQVATALREAVLPAGWTMRTVGRAEADITDAAAVESIVASTGPDLVINAAAYTAVDRAESEPELAFAVNRDGAAHVARACARADIPLIHISTDYVFDGKAAGHAYRESDPVNPLSAYGVSKAAGENAVRAVAPRHAIVRTSWIYGPHGQNFVRTMLRMGEARPELGIVDDQYGSPTAASDIADALIAMAVRILALPADAGAGGGTNGGSELFGTFHFCGTGWTTWFGLAYEVFSQASAHNGGMPGLRPIATVDYPTPAVRPANSVLNCQRLADVYGITAPPWRSSLKACVTRLCAEAARMAEIENAA
jgi:dTDP-4-dehydrorhamnose reductase